MSEDFDATAPAPVARDRPAAQDHPENQGNTKIPAKSDLRRRGEAYLEQSRDDLKTARRMVKDGRPLDGAYLSFQAAANALSAVCFLNGVVRVPNHSTVALLAACREADPSFSAPEDACAELEAVQARNPFGSGRDPDEEKRFARACQTHGAAVVKAVEKYFKKKKKHKTPPGEK